MGSEQYCNAALPMLASDIDTPIQGNDYQAGPHRKIYVILISAEPPGDDTAGLSQYSTRGSPTPGTCSTDEPSLLSHSTATPPFKWRDVLDLAWKNSPVTENGIIVLGHQRECRFFEWLAVDSVLQRDGMVFVTRTMQVLKDFHGEWMLIKQSGTTPRSVGLPGNKHPLGPSFIDCLYLCLPPAQRFPFGFHGKSMTFSSRSDIFTERSEEYEVDLNNRDSLEHHVEALHANFDCDCDVRRLGLTRAGPCISADLEHPLWKHQRATPTGGSWNQPYPPYNIDAVRSIARQSGQLQLVISPLSNGCANPTLVLSSDASTIRPITKRSLQQACAAEKEKADRLQTLCLAPPDPSQVTQSASSRCPARRSTAGT